MTHPDDELLLAEACDWTTTQEHQSLTIHWGECPPCLDRFAQFCAERTILEETALRGWRDRRSRPLVAVALILLAVAIGGILWRGKDSQPLPSEQTARRNPEPEATLPAPAQEPKEEDYAFLGQLVPIREVSIFSKVQAYVDHVEAARGAAIKKGDLLAQLRAPELVSLCEEARVRLAQDDAELQRMKVTAASGLTTAQELANAQNRVAIDKARLGTCEANVSYLRILAPFDGTIVDRMAEEGSLVGPPQGSAESPLFKIQNVDRLRLVISLPASSEPTLAAVKPGDHVSFVRREESTRKRSGAFLGSTRTVDPATGTFTVDVEVDNSSRELFPGMFVQASWPPRK
jgi:RND family efflux transporter MFP subunit